MIYYSNRYLSNILSINILKWKRWVREFLPADPLGGRQSGYARQLNLRDSFKVYFAGYLVSKLKFSIPEAQMILTDLTSWLKQQGYLNLQLPEQAAGSAKPQHRVYIFDNDNDKFAYAIRSVFHLKIENESERARSMRLEEFELTLIGTNQDGLLSDQIPGARVVALTALYRQFCEAVKDFG